MTIQERLEYAEQRLQEEAKNGDSCDINYWRGYYDAVKRIADEDTDNSPLTLAELHKLCGEPVWIEGRYLAQYDVYYGSAINGLEQFYKAALPCRDYGPGWRAYRRKPKGRENK